MIILQKNLKLDQQIFNDSLQVGQRARAHVALVVDGPLEPHAAGGTHRRKSGSLAAVHHRVGDVHLEGGVVDGNGGGRVESSDLVHGHRGWRRAVELEGQLLHLLRRLLHVLVQSH